MRELKFRVWDKENNCFFKPTYEAYKGRLEDLSIDLSGDLTIHTYDTPFIHESVFPNRFIIQQYTGLKDRKNGTEMYEGDLVKGKNYGFNNPKEYIGQIVYDYNQYMVKGVGQYKGKVDELNVTYEVIGNVYENSELLQTGGVAE